MDELRSLLAARVCAAVAIDELRGRDVRLISEGGMYPGGHEGVRAYLDAFDTQLLHPHSSKSLPRRGKDPVPGLALTETTRFDPVGQQLVDTVLKAFRVMSAGGEPQAAIDALVNSGCAGRAAAALAAITGVDPTGRLTAPGRTPTLQVSNQQALLDLAGVGRVTVPDRYANPRIDYELDRVTIFRTAATIAATIEADLGTRADGKRFVARLLSEPRLSKMLTALAVEDHGVAVPDVWPSRHSLLDDVASWGYEFGGDFCYAPAALQALWFLIKSSTSEHHRKMHRLLGGAMCYLIGQEIATPAQTAEFAPLTGLTPADLHALARGNCGDATYTFMESSFWLECDLLRRARVTA